MKIIYHFKKCVNCGLCVSVRPDLWHWGEDGKARLKEPDRVGEQREEKAVQDLSKMEVLTAHCPTEAIKLED